MKWKKPNGVEIETNDLEETVTYCQSLGWEEVSGQASLVEESQEEAPEEVPKRRGRPPKNRE